MTRWPYLRRSLHVCAKAPDLRIVFNDLDVRVASLSGLPPMVCCPFCGKHLASMTCERDEKYRVRAHVASPADCAAAVVEAVRRLERPGCPDDACCSHFGVSSVDASPLNVGINVSYRGPHLQVTLYKSLFPRPAALHRARVEAVAAALVTSIRETWNGGDGHEGISVVLGRSPPDSLVYSIGNYLSLGFKIFDRDEATAARFRSFGDWYRAPLEATM